MKENLLVDLSRQFAVDIIKLYDIIRETKNTRLLSISYFVAEQASVLISTRATTLQAEQILSTNFRLRLKNAMKLSIGLILCAMQSLSLEKHMMIILPSAVK